MPSHSSTPSSLSPPFSEGLRLGLTRLALAAVYFAAGKVGLTLAVVHASASPVWPPTGIALAAFLVLGYRVWPGILLGAFLVNLTTPGSVATAFGIAVGNTLEGLTGAYLVNRLARGAGCFDRAQDVFKFALLGGLVATMVSATIGTTTLALAGFARWEQYARIWLTWWLGDAGGALVVAPLLVLWSRPRRLRWRGRAVEAVALLLATVLAGLTVFGGALSVFGLAHAPLTFLTIPALIWAAFRFGRRGAATLIVVLAGIAVIGTLRGFGPFAVALPNERLLMLQAFMGTIAVMTLAVAALVGERRRANEEQVELRTLAERERTRLAAVVEHMPLGVIIVEIPSERILLANAQVEQILRLKLAASDPIMNYRKGRGFHADGRAYEQDDWPLARAIATGEVVVNEEIRFLRGDGSRATLLVSAAPIRGSAGRTFAGVVVFQDITERKAVETTREMLAAIVDSSEDAILGTSLEGTIVSWNRGAEKLYGYAATEILGTSVRALAPAGTAGDLAEMLEGLRHGEKIEGHETVHRSKDGRSVDVSLTVSPIHAEGEVVGASVIGRDVGGRREAERRQAELLAREQAARAEAEEANRAKDEFLAMLSHELRNPLAAIVTAAGLLQQRRDGDEPAAAQPAGVIGRQARHLSRLVDDLLDVARMTRGKVDLRPQPVDLAETARRALAAVRSAPGGAHHAITVEAEPAWVRGDSVRLEQVVTNLLVNAMRYTDPGGKIEVRVGREDDHAVLRVRDSGQGIAPDLLPRVFDLFVQGTRLLDRSEGGLGLGLTLVRRIVEAHAGCVEVASEGPGRGSTFTVRLPAVEPPSAARDVRGAAPAASRRVVIIEDNEDGREMLRVALQLLGHDVHVAEDGLSGIEATLRIAPDVALIDIGLPGLNGYEVAQRIRADSRGKSIVLIAVTGYGQPEDRRRSAAAGFDVHVVKPVDPAQLAELIGAAQTT